jgi:hypothetical protein
MADFFIVKTPGFVYPIHCIDTGMNEYAQFASANHCIFARSAESGLVPAPSQLLKSKQKEGS